MKTSETFQSAKHKQRFLAVIDRIGRQNIMSDPGGIDPEYGAALLVLTADAGTWQKARDYVDSEGIDFEGLLQEGAWSSGEMVLLQWAANLFNGQVASCNPVELMRLDERNFRLALAALQLRRYGLKVSNAEMYNAVMDERNRMSAESREKPWLPWHDGE